MALFLYPMERESYDSLLIRSAHLYQMKWMEFIDHLDCNLRYYSCFTDYIAFTFAVSRLLENYKTFDELLKGHTLYNLTSYFFNDDYKHKFYESLVSDTIQTNKSTKQRLLFRTGIWTSWQNRHINSRRFCPKCILEQKQKYGTTWQRIEWIIFGLELCPKHRCRLVYADPEKYFLTFDELTEYPRTIIDYSNKKPEFFMENVMAIVNGEVPPVDSGIIFNYIVERLKDLKLIEGYKTDKNQYTLATIKNYLLKILLCDYWGEEFIRLFFEDSYSIYSITRNLRSEVSFQSIYLSRWFYSLITILALSQGKNIKEIIQEIK